MNYGALLLLLVLLSKINCKVTDICTQRSSCLCEYDKYSKIDLKKLSEENDLKSEHFLTDADINIKFTYFFHGCTNGYFNSKHYYNNNITKEANTSLIYFNKSANVFTVLGDSKQIRLHVNPTEKFLVYKTANGSVSATVNLICTDYKKSELKIITTSPVELALFSPYACVLTDHPTGLSWGTTILLIFSICCIIYFCGGGLIMYFLRGARGYEVIPNVDFWRELPGLVKDGTIFLFNGCNASFISTAETYDKI